MKYKYKSIDDNKSKFINISNSNKLIITLNFNKLMIIITLKYKANTIMINRWL